MKASKGKNTKETNEADIIEKKTTKQVVEVQHFCVKERVALAPTKK